MRISTFIIICHVYSLYVYILTSMKERKTHSHTANAIKSYLDRKTVEHISRGLAECGILLV